MNTILEAKIPEYGSIQNVILNECCFYIFLQPEQMVVVAQLVRASDCDSEGRGFEPPRLPKSSGIITPEDFFLPVIAAYPHIKRLTKHYCKYCVIT